MPVDRPPITPPTDPGDGGELAAKLAELEVPPAWLADVTSSYGIKKPWKDARLEIRRLLGENKEKSRREAIKLTWDYLQKGDIGDGHEYPMYMFLGGEPVWAVRAYEEFLAKPHDNSPIHAEISLAALYAQFGEFQKAERLLAKAGGHLPDPPWRVMRQADVHDALGDVYAAWGRTDDATTQYEDAARLYPTAKPPYGGNLLGRRAAQVKAKLELLATAALGEASLKDGVHRERALGYSGDVNLTVHVLGGRISKIDVKHSEKIDQGATTIIPRRIVDEQSLQVDGVSGATVTKDAIITGTYGALRKAGL